MQNTTCLPATKPVTRHRLTTQPSAGQIEADVATVFGHVRTVRQSWNDSIEVVGVSDHHWLQLSLLPSTHTERGCFSDDWESFPSERIGELFLLPAGQPVHIRSECRSQVAVACALDPKAIHDWLSLDFQWTEARLKGSLNLDNPVLRNLLLKLREELRNPGLASDALAGFMVGQIAIELGRHLVSIEQTPAAGGLAAWRLRAIDDRLALPGEPPSLGELARLVGLSVRQVARGFHAARGCSVGRYVAAQRMVAAKRLLVSDRSLKSTAHALGFSSAANFNAAFRQATGETPGAYRLRARLTQEAEG